MTAEEELPDLQSLWETAQREVALEGSSGCTLERLWHLVGLSFCSTPDASTGGRAQTDSPQDGRSAGGTEGDDVDPRGFLKGWLWR